MEVYAPMIAVTVLLAWLAKHVKGIKNKKFMFAIATLPSVIVAALRYDNGADYLMYLRMMKTYAASGAGADSFTDIKRT